MPKFVEAAHTNHPIALAVAPLRLDAMQDARQWAKQQVRSILADLEKHNWDVNACAPYPSTVGMGRMRYLAAKRKYDRYRALTRNVTTTYRLGEPCYVKPDSGRIGSFILHAMQGAELAFFAYVDKLIHKTMAGGLPGAILSASLDDNHGLWEYSLLRIKRELHGRKSLETWKTQRIRNVSVLGLRFTQWPTRLVKD
jgi:hypothetical protein